MTALSQADVVRVDAPPTDPDLIGNRNFWSKYAWTERGDEWSDKWGSTEAMWFGSLYPRLHAFLPARHILEIAPGFGRVTNSLRRWCDKLTVVDLVDRCIEACRERFAGDSHISYVVNDGRSLEMIEDGSVDLAVSWDSLVHCEMETIQAYIRQLRTKLCPGGAAFIHHSNLGEHFFELTGHEPGEVVGGRRKSVTAEKVRGVCREAGLRCVSQEIVPWNCNGLWMDCFSLIVRDEANVHEPTRVERRHDWAIELANAKRVGEMYRRLAMRE